MKYQVVWKTTAEAELAAIWNEANDRPAVSRAADRLDEELRSKPWEIGESRFDNFRVAFEAPLGVIFAVVDATRQVFVLRVWMAE